MDKIGSETLKRMESIPHYNTVIFSRLARFMNGKILEVGCGIGSFTEMLSNLGEVYALDFEKQYVAHAKKRLQSRAHVGLGDIEKGKFFFPQNTRFNSIVCLNVLEHIERDTLAIKNMYTLLKKGGQVFLLTPAHQSFFGEIDKGLSHFRRYSKASLSTIFRDQGFIVDECYYFNALGGLGWFVNSRILKRKVLPSKQLRLFSIVSRPFLFMERFIHPSFGLSVIIVAHK